MFYIILMEDMTYLIFRIAYIGFFYFIAPQSLSIAPKVCPMIYAFSYRCI